MTVSSAPMMTNDIDQETLDTFSRLWKEDMAQFLVENRNIRARTNYTNEWIQAQGQPLINELIAHLSRKMPRSYVLGKVEDHVFKFLFDIIRRDAIGKRLAKGQKTHISQVKAWCLRNAHTQNRDAGVDAVTRCMHGALTRKEWTNTEYQNWSTKVVPKNSKDLFELENIKSQMTGIDEINDQDAFEKMVQKIEAILTKNVPNEIGLYMDVFERYFIASMKIKEVAESLEIPMRDVSRVINKTRKILHREKKAILRFRLEG